MGLGNIQVLLQSIQSQRADKGLNSSEVRMFPLVIGYNLSRWQDVLLELGQWFSRFHYVFSLIFLYFVFSKSVFIK